MYHNTKSLKQKVSLSLDAEVLDQIKQMAMNDGRPVSSYVNRILHYHIKKIVNKNRKYLNS